MDNNTRQRLRKACASMLKNAQFKLPTARAKAAVHAFWVGALHALDDPEPDVWVTICLMSGRHEDLCDFSTEPAEVPQ